MRVALCVDFGSTFTKAALVDTGSGALLGSASHPTTIGTDVLEGYDACRAVLAERHPEVADARVLACSSAGGGLRIAVVGNEELVTAEAGRRVALSSGGKVVLVLAGGLDGDKLHRLREAEPDVLLLVGGTDGGNSETLRHDAAFLARNRWRRPVVVAGDVEAQEEVASRLAHGGTPYVLADNVVPRIGVLTPASARRAIREMFLAHVIGGKHLSRRADPAAGAGGAFTRMVRGATPDLVLQGVEVLGDLLGGAGVVVVDVGGATTDVHSVVELDAEATLGDAGLSREVVAPTPVTRTVEGDLGMRWSATTTVAAAGAEGLVEAGRLTDAAVRRSRDPGFLPGDDTERHEDELIATAAVTLAMRRHVGRSQVVVSPEGRVVQRTGKDLREVGLLVGSGGVLRAVPPEVADRILRSVVGVHADGWQLPEHPRVVVDQDYVLAAVGLLAEEHLDAARRLAARLLATP
ncbi:MAG TPA: glutamate mutase L [Marmoricola sp.]|nr:glutamate mutase L [Marmoricola sp.]